MSNIANDIVINHSLYHEMTFDFIDSVITGDWISNNPQLLKGTWSSFFKDAKKYEVFLYGTGRACRKFIALYENKIKICALVDSNPLKQGNEFLGYKILSPKELKERGENVVILITSTTHQEDISFQLNDLGIKRYYGLATLEANNPTLKLLAEKIQNELWDKLPIKSDRILINRYNGSMKSIIDYMLNEGFDGEILSLYPNKSGITPKEIKLVKNDVISQIIAYSTSKIWIEDFKKPIWVKKKPGQFYINVWHGCVPLKKIDLDIKSITKKYEDIIVHDSDLIDLRISNGKYCSASYRSAMAYKGKILECGSPRLDCLFKKTDDIRETLNIPSDAKIAVYAPTYRTADGNNYFGSAENNFDLDFAKIKFALEKRFGGTFYICFRLHPSALRTNLPKGNFFVNVSEFDDIYEILKSSDVIISDFSSVIFEAGYINKPVFLYASDYENYRKNRGIYIEWKDLPFPHAYNPNDLEQVILDFKENDYLNKLHKYNSDVLGIVENGTACEQVIKVINKVLAE